MIRFINKNKNISAKTETAIIVATQFLLSKLIRGNVTILFEWKDLAYPEYAYIIENENQRKSYTISLSYALENNNNLLLRSIAHELIHVKQRATGQLSQPFPNMPFVFAWKEKNGEVKYIKNLQKENFSTYQEYEKAYLALPWEQEAFKKMDALYLSLYEHFYKESTLPTLFHFFRFYILKNQYPYFKNAFQDTPVKFSEIQIINKIICAD